MAKKKKTKSHSANLRCKSHSETNKLLAKAKQSKLYVDFPDDKASLPEGKQDVQLDVKSNVTKTNKLDTRIYVKIPVKRRKIWKKGSREGDLDLIDPRLQKFDKYHLRELKRSRYTIDEYIAKVVEKVEAKITEEEFRQLREDEKTRVALHKIAKRKGIHPSNLSFWARVKLGIEIQSGKRGSREGDLDLTDPCLQKFDKRHLQRLIKSSYTIDEYITKIAEEVETKITEQEFRQLREDENNQLSLREIAKRKGIHPSNLSFWARVKLRIEIQSGKRGSREGDLDLTDSRLQKFDKYHLFELKQSSYTIEEYITKVAKKVEGKITEEEFRQLYEDEKNRVPLYKIAKMYGIHPNNLSFWARVKLGVDTNPIIEGSRESDLDLTDPRLQKFDKHHLQRLKKSNCTIDEYIAKIAEKVEAKITEKEFRQLHEDEKNQLSLRKIAKRKGIQRTNLSFWAKVKLGMNIEFQRYTQRYDYDHILDNYGERYNNGESIRALAAEIGITHQTLSRILDQSTGIERRDSDNPKGIYQKIIPDEYLTRYEQGEDPNLLIKELNISIDSFIAGINLLSKDSKEWENYCEQIVKELDPTATFQKPHVWGKPDIIYTRIIADAKLRIIADAKLNGASLSDSIKKYAPCCDILEFWCLRNPQKNDIYIDPITGKVTDIIFYSPLQLIARIPNKEKSAHFTEELNEKFYLNQPTRDLDELIGTSTETKPEKSME